MDSGNEPLCREDIDVSNGVMYIFYDPDTSVIYLAGKVSHMFTVGYSGIVSSKGATFS